MKRIVSTLLSALIGLMLSAPPPARADTGAKRTYVLGVSPCYEKTDREAVLKSLLVFALEGAAPGDALLVYDALNLQPVSRLKIPEGAAFEKNPRARVQRLKEEVGKLQRFFLEQAPQPSPEPGLIHAPQFLALAGSQLRQPGQPLTVVLIGSPLYVDANEPAFNMTDGFYPSDGHLLATQQVSVYGTADKKDTLKGVSVHYGYLRENFVSDAARSSIGRVWALFIGEQAGVLGSFAADVSLVLDRARQNVQQPCIQANVNQTDLKLQMHRVVRRELSAQTDWITSEAAPQKAAPPPAGVGKLKVGIQWKPDVDLDLYVRPRPGATELFYGKSRSAEGFHQKDFVDSPAKSNGFETVELFSDVDLNQVSAAVNFYSGTCPGGVSGIVRVMFNGQLYQGAFKISASSGNKGAESANRDRSKYWRVLDIAKIVGLKK